MIDTFAELIWGGSDKFKVVDINSELSLSNSVSANYNFGEDSKEILAKMETMENDMNLKEN